MGKKISLTKIIATLKCLLMLLKYIDHDKKAELNTQLVKHNVS